MSAPTTEEVRAQAALAQACGEYLGSYNSMARKWLADNAVSIAEHRDALAAAIAILRVDIEHLHRAASEAERMRLDLMTERDALTAEVARLREVIATKHAIERSSVGVAALVEECETLRVEVARLRKTLTAVLADDSQEKST